LSKVRQTFAAQAFHPDFGAELVNGEILFVGWVLRFRAGHVTLEIPLDRLVVETESDDGRMVFTDPGRPELKIFTSGPELLSQRTLPQVERIRQQLTTRLTRRELSQRLKLVLYFLAACAVLAWVGAVAMRFMVRSIVERVPPQWQAQLGSNVLAELKTGMVFVDDTNYVDALTEFAAPLLRAWPGGSTNYLFYVIQEDKPNAVALPGGHILVTTGLMEMTDRPEELLAVIAHEVAHLTQKHHLRKMISAGGPFLIVQTFLGGRGGSLGMVTGVSALMVMQGFSQEYEQEADEVGWEHLLKANIDPRGMIGVFRKFGDYEKAHGALDVPQAFSSHPALQKRIRRLEAKWQRLPRKTGFLDLGGPPDPTLP
jgi:predicted Zn-dependent protease